MDPDAAGCADERVRFLTTEPVGTQVRPAILASWQRSRASGVAADRVAVPYVRDPDVDTPLTRSAEPVLRRLADRLHGTPVSIILTDPAGLVLRRRTDDVEFERRLDRVLLAPGFTYAERFAGTNGIGTALESGRATVVLGHEHYAENLETFACGAAPIRDPRTGRTAGVLNLTCRRADADGLLLILAETTADQIERALAEAVGPGEFDLLRAYRRACTRTTGAVIAVGADTVMLNDRARSAFDATDQGALVAHVTECGSSLAVGNRGAVRIALPGGTTARASVLRVGDGEPPPLVVHVRVDSMPAREARAPAAPSAMPGLAGTSTRWHRACGQVDRAVRRAESFAIRGERGVGKQSLLRAALARHDVRARVVDAAESSAGGTRYPWRERLDGDTLVVLHADALAAAALADLVAVLRGTPPRRFAITVRGDGLGADELVSLCSVTVDLPALRLRREDIADLATALLDRVAGGRSLTWSPEVVGMLVRAPWPGNVTELFDVVQALARRHRSGRIEAAELPAALRASCPRVLTPLESLERDAIVSALTDADGSKPRAARLLGISRATIYRRIHEYGIRE